MNAKTWQTIGGFSLGLCLAIAAFFFFPPSHPVLRCLNVACLATLVVLGLMGAWFGILLCFGRLYFGCPFCGARSRAVGVTSKHLYLDCPSCGAVCVTSRPFRTATAFKLDSEIQ